MELTGREIPVKPKFFNIFFNFQEFLSLARQVAYDEKYRNRLALGGKTYISNNHSLSLEKETYKSIVRILMK